jgi:20S proteasome alpha/beta subunit
MLAKLALMLLLAGYQYGGTFIGAVICSDGIVVASDSRTTFMDGSGKPFAYLDGMPKIFVDHGAAVAVSGLSSLDGELFSSFVTRNHDLLSRPVNEIMFSLLVWMPFTNSNNVGMISAGFNEGKPMICAKAPIVPQECFTTGFMSSKGSPVLRERLLKLDRLPTTEEAAAALKAAIDESSKNDLTVGGPISVLKLTNVAPPQWAGSPPTDHDIAQICDLVHARRNDIVSLQTKDDMDRHLNAACPLVKGR